MSRRKCLSPPKNKKNAQLFHDRVYAHYISELKHVIYLSTLAYSLEFLLQTLVCSLVCATKMRNTAPEEVATSGALLRI